jgi:hypothetical protein
MRYLWWLLTRPAMRVKRWLQILFSRHYTTSMSGKRTKRRGFLRAGEEVRFCTLPLVDGKVKYTLEEIESMTIRCAWCGCPIFIGDLVTVTAPRDPLFCVPEGAFVQSWDPLTVVGCDRDTCTDTCMEICGQWQPNESTTNKGRVLFPSFSYA